MIGKSKYLILIIVIICVSGLITIYFFHRDKPLEVIETKLNIKLLSSVKVVNFDYYTGSDLYGFGAKILIPTKDLGYVKKAVSSYFGSERERRSPDNVPNFEDRYSWWDLDKQNIEVYFMKFVDIKKWSTLRTIQQWAFITKDKKGQYYLYISY